MKLNDQTILVTGGAGFIGSNLVHYLHKERPDCRIVVVDKLTYAGNRTSLEPLLTDGVVQLAKVDIADEAALQGVFEKYKPRAVFHLAAESHVDRSISGPRPFIESNIVGTYALLECCRAAWADGQGGRLLHVSTDEVFGSLGETGLFTEETPYDPSSPYSASKAASDHLVRAWNRTFGLDVVLTNCSNNFGPRQYPEKLIPVIIRNIRDLRPLPVYGDGSNVRDWLYVEDHCSALLAAMEDGVSSRSYNIGAQNEWTNLKLVQTLCDLMDEELHPDEPSRNLISFVTDRPGHDQRYAIDSSRARAELNWEPAHSFEEALRHTLRWYLAHLPVV
jgi:dTDP-glucose 4,6-dehydratase